MKKEDLYKLSDPNFHESELGLLPMWKPDAKDDTKRIILPYYSNDQLKVILDGVCGADGWQTEFLGINNIVFCNLSINIDGQWIIKSDAGGPRETRVKNKTEVERLAYQMKTTATDAFVRAASAWGLDRSLLLLPAMKLDLHGDNVKTPKGQVLTSPEELTAYCNQVSTSEGWLYQVYRANKAHFDGNERGMGLLTDLKEFIKSLKA